MRKRGQYIQDKRLQFKKGFQTKFLLELKQKSNLSWQKLAKSFNISGHTLRWDLYKEKSTFPYKLAEQILDKYPIMTFDELKNKFVCNILEKNWGQKKAGKKYKKKINYPRKSEQLAELFGVILGDGHLYTKGLRITGNVLEKYHYNYIAVLIERLFGLKSKIYISYTNPNSIILNVYSKELVNFLMKHGLRTGNKLTNRVSFPKWIFKNKKFIFSSLRGFLDTDGGIYAKQKNYNRVFIEFQTHSIFLRRDIIKLLKKGDFSPSKSTFNIRIQDQSEVYKFFKLIGSSNPKNIIRLKEFVLNKNIPLKNELKNKIISFRGNLPFKLQS